MVVLPMVFKVFAFISVRLILRVLPRHLRPLLVQLDQPTTAESMWGIKMISKTHKYKFFSLKLFHKNLVQISPTN